MRNTPVLGTGGVAQVAECLPVQCKAVSSNSSAANRWGEEKSVGSFVSFC
jgi:hypothetical protein